MGKILGTAIAALDKYSKYAKPHTANHRTRARTSTWFSFTFTTVQEAR